MARNEIYLGPPTFKHVEPVIVGEMTVANQARMFNVPEEQLQPEAEVEVQVKSGKPNKHQMPKAQRISAGLTSYDM